MNIEKLFNAVSDDEMNSSLGLICLELENQGYQIKIEGIEVTSDEIFNGKAEYLELLPDKYIFEIVKESGTKQKFVIRFIDYHNFILERS